MKEEQKISHNSEQGAFKNSPQDDGIKGYQPSSITASALNSSISQKWQKVQKKTDDPLNHTTSGFRPSGILAPS